jgi:hypothetical protein
MDCVGCDAVITAESPEVRDPSAGEPADVSGAYGNI